MRRLCVLAMAVCVLAAAPADMGHEARARALFTEARCLTCVGESVADSPSDFAVDVRQLIRDRIAAGDSDVAIRARLRQQFGDSILTRPPFDGGTWVLWLGPLAVLLVGGVALWRLQRRVTAL